MKGVETSVGSAVIFTLGAVVGIRLTIGKPVGAGVGATDKLTSSGTVTWEVIGNSRP